MGPNEEEKERLRVLSYFNQYHIDEMIDKDLSMHYANLPRKRKECMWGVYFPMGEYIKSPTIIIHNHHNSFRFESLTIQHEWLHAYENLVLGLKIDEMSSEKIIDLAARFLFQLFPEYIGYIRWHYQNEGFLDDRSLYPRNTVET